jgi:predicted GTPase
MNPILISRKLGSAIIDHYMMDLTSDYNPNALSNTLNSSRLRTIWTTSQTIYSRVRMVYIRQRNLILSAREND